ncbi:ATP-binding cassette domain-containing protein [Novosphingobium mangrovi (ex Huang et al. 2023)]|uniref:ATP-binding cassette domain-containing protein n=1 Tax=Novosphingobium mangrovi (ex Huang et al. 2023) TaxID=2976432 RepID=A0ABT2I1V9_9SPHN|nr:ATP-binding cassette domain-containing protein [Novosphingobium mangrovi (ex Huang et al. 2023)]MCT2398795.1 ATP-binding cassette domain-containing protein [Novosphingobium mangrovi (ex Huang et al. 2023)]
MSTDAQPIVSVRNASRHFGRVTALSDVSMDLYPGQVTALLGDNGAGKSTFITMLSGVFPPSSGEIQMDGKPVHFASPHDARAAGIATVFQGLALIEDRSIADNLFLGCEPVRFGFLLDRKRMVREAKGVLEQLKVNLPPVTTSVRFLSGGQRQAVAVARTIVTGSKLVIMDEPTAALGVRETGKVLDLIRRLRDQGTSVLLISHNMDDVFSVADRAVVLRLGRKVADVAIRDVTREQIVGLVMGGERAPERDKQEAAA